MLKLAVIYHEPETEGMDLSRPELGNPGCGGTAFCFALLLQALEQCDEIELKVFSVQALALPVTGFMQVKDVEQGLALAGEQGYGIALLRGHQEAKVYAALQCYGLKYIFWMHNRLTYEEICCFRSTDCVNRVIAVGREMYDLYIDDDVIRKMDYILNPFIPPSVPPEGDASRGNASPKGVCYGGALIPDKNFHLLADAWKEILEAVPRARLHVIGSGALYEPGAKAGPFGYASEDYEGRFMQGLTDEAGKQLASVTFHGILGTEKYEVFRDSAVGVINPMATETFGLAAVEMEAVGVPIVCRRKNGLPDAVRNGETGLLYKEISGLPKNIIRLLTDEELQRRMREAAIAFATSAFLPEKLLPEWLRVLREVAEERPATYRRPKTNMDNNNKRARRLVHGLRQIPLLHKLPSIHDLQRK